MAQDRKYGAVEIPGIPDDEPVFIIRAKDKCSPRAIRRYAEEAEGVGASAELLADVEQVAQIFDRWQADWEPIVKVPD